MTLNTIIDALLNNRNLFTDNIIVNEVVINGFPYIYHWDEELEKWKATTERYKRVSAKKNYIDEKEDKLNMEN